MHLFKNKTKDVKQFLEEMKANKTNRSSNASNLDKKNSRPPQVVSPEPYRTEYQSNSIGQNRTSQFQNHSRNPPSNFPNHDSSSFRGSVVSNSMSMNAVHSVGNNFAHVPPQQQISHLPQRISQQEQNFYKGPHPIYNKPSHFQEPDQLANFEPVSEPNYNDYSHSLPSNRNLNFYDPTRSHVHYQKPIQQPFNPYHSEIQQPYFQNNFQANKNFNNQFFEERRTQNLNQTLNQHSNSTKYEDSQFYQNSNSMRPQSRPPQALISQPKLPKFQKPAQNQSFLPHQIKNKIPKSNSQLDTRSENHQFQTSQPPLNKINGQRLYTSQLGQRKSQMDQISQADDCFSTENDSPAKLTEFLSKTKYDIEQIHETQESREIEELRSMEIENQNNKKPFTIKEKKQEARLAKIQEVKPAQKSLTPVKKNFSPSRNSSQIKHQDVSPIRKENQKFQNQSSLNIKTKPKQSQIKISQNQSHRLQKSLHQIDQVHIKLDQILKETSIIFSNIKRSDENFRKMIENNGILDKRGKNRGQSNRMEIEGEEIKMNVRDAPTDKKQKNQKIEMEINEKQTYKKKRGNIYEEVDI